MLKAFTLHEPFASLMAIGAKMNETRGIRTSIRGDVAIHAAKNAPDFSKELYDAALKAMTDQGYRPKPEFLGCILCVVEIYDVVPSEKFFRESQYIKASVRAMEIDGKISLSDEEWAFGNYEPGRFIFRTRNLRVLKTPVHARGCQALGWTVPPEVEAEVRRQLRRTQTQK